MLHYNGAVREEWNVMIAKKTVWFYIPFLLFWRIRSIFGDSSALILIILENFIFFKKNELFYFHLSSSLHESNIHPKENSDCLECFEWMSSCNS